MSEHDHNPLYGVTRGTQGCVLVRWSEMTDEERERAWRDYEKAFGKQSEAGSEAVFRREDRARSRRRRARRRP